ncbi:MAG: hypothetical protein JO253_03565 [Alphaproteobacteria bacterium]|nr:hypothetical protein [Alphaproteobacteria bacterium]
MASKVVIAVSATTTVEAPAGTVFGGYEFTLTDVQNNVIKASSVSGTSAEFDGIADGVFTLNVNSLDSTGAVIKGTTLTEQVTVTSVAPPAQVSVVAASAVTVTVTPQ